ncbi:keratin, type I cytoskeletal 9-like [Drosophila miranda]|uniref:keratin, type I cytoskeletal 9-like n=1 Tax=Drosophila miranda TaxID=7229 RepID=UPI00143F76FC|nr:keratin, type I cytoskeletal 9-like [Drosophila miranda]
MLLHPNCTQSTFPPNLHTRLQPDSKPDHAHANSNANTHPTRSPDQSGFDNSGHGYYVATDEDDGDMRTRGNGNGNGYAYSRPPQSLSSPCGRLAGNCPYGGGSKVSSSAISSESSRGGGHTSVLGSDAGIKPNGQGSWTYLGDQDKSEGSGSSSGGSNGGGSGSSGSASMSSGSSRDRERERDRDRDAQSSSYGGRPRPLGVSYLLERDSGNAADASSDGPSDPASPAGGGGEINGEGMPIPAAQTASEGNPGKTMDNARQ